MAAKLDILEVVKQRLGPVVKDSHERLGEATIVIDGADLRATIDTLRADPQLSFDWLVDLTGVDYSEMRANPITARVGYPPANRFECVYHFFSFRNTRRIRVRARLDETNPEIMSVSDLWASAIGMEREAWDMFGFKFRGHPNLKRIFMHENFVGHPLRKDYPIDRRQGVWAPVDLLGYTPEDLEEMGRESDGNPVVINLGPSHPAMHGVYRIEALVHHETILKAEGETGYLHRGFEKSCEKGPWNDPIPYADRLNYVSALMNNVGYCMAVEKMMGIELPERGKYVRVIVCELNRIMDHLVNVGTNLVDIGALTNFWYFFNAREKINNLIEKLTGARLTNSYTRIGGVIRDLEPAWCEELAALVGVVQQAVEDVMGLVRRNRIFYDRTVGIGVFSKEDALSWGWTGPCLRASGVPYDVRKAAPYYHYDELDFDVAVGENGDSYDRMMVRVEEIHQSSRIILQALKKMPGGPVSVNDPRITLPPKKKVYTSMEALINHFMLVFEGMRPAAGETYSYTEAANGELGFYIVSDGSPHPYRVHARGPCFMMWNSFAKMVEGLMVADAVAVFGGLNVIAGECER